MGQYWKKRLKIIIHLQSMHGIDDSIHELPNSNFFWKIIF